MKQMLAPGLAALSFLTHADGVEAARNSEFGAPGRRRDEARMRRADAKRQAVHKALASCLAAICLAFAAQARAQFPDRPIHLVVPFPAGGVTDVIARAIAEPMSASLGQAVVIDNKPGADGLIAGEWVARAKPDGYTLLFASASGVSYAPAIHKAMPYDALRDFTPIGRVGTFGFFVYTSTTLPVRSLPELIAYARAHPGEVNHGSATGTALLGITQLGRSQQVSFAQVQYAGDAKLAPDLIAGRVQLAFASGVHLPQVADGKLRALATALPMRSPLAPEVPTFQEAGVPALAIEPWAAVFGPARMPPEIAQRLARELAATLQRPAVRERLARVAFEARSSTPEELAEFTRVQLKAWREAAQAAGLQPQ